MFDCLQSRTLTTAMGEVAYVTNDFSSANHAHPPLFFGMALAVAQAAMSGRRSIRRLQPSIPFLLWICLVGERLSIAINPIRWRLMWSTCWSALAN